MAKKNAVVKRTPEMLAKAQERIASIDASIEEQLNLASKGYLGIAPLIAEVYDNDYFVVKGYKNIDQYAEAEHGMAHGTVSGLRKVYARFGSTIEHEDGTKSYTIPDKYMDWGYTKLHLIASEEKNFKEAGLEPFEVFTPDMTIKTMRETLALKLEDKAKKQDENAIDTTAKDVESNTADNNTADNNTADNNTADNNTADNNTADNNAADNETSEVREASFNDYLAQLNDAIDVMRDFLKNDINEVKACASTIKGQTKTLEACYNKAHAIATVKDTKKNK